MSIHPSTELIIQTDGINLSVSQQAGKSSSAEPATTASRLTVQVVMQDRDKLGTARLKEF
jgi:hypothetical protein